MPRGVKFGCFKMKKKYFILIVGIFLIGFVSALISLPPAKLNQEYIIKQTCSSCTHINITISNINGIILNNVEMSNNGSGTWVYDFTPTILGRHEVTGEGDLDGTNTGFATYFPVTPNGEEISTGQSILYVIFIGILFGLIIMLFYFIVVMPKDNERNERGEIIKILKLKYLRIFLISLLYPLIIILLNLTNGLAVNFSTLSMFSGILGFLFGVMLRGAWVFTLIIIFWVLYNLIKDSNVKKNIKKLGRFRLNG